MSYADLVREITGLDTVEQKRFILEVVPELWSKVCDDETCAFKIKGLVDRDIVRSKQEIYM